MKSAVLGLKCRTLAHTRNVVSSSWPDTEDPTLSLESTLPSLLRITLDGLEQAHIARGAGNGVMPSLDEWSNLLRVLDAAGRDRSELPTMLRLSKRAVRTRITSAVRYGRILVLKASPGQELVRLTDSYSNLPAHWQSLQHAAEKQWQQKVGADHATALRAALEEVVAKLTLEHPHYPASYGPADASITGGNGQDWKAVPRGAGDTVSYLPLSALLSQNLVAFAMDYETRSPVALSLSAAVIMRIPPVGLPLKGFGNSVGISALNRHGFVLLNGSRSSGTIYLTRKGLEVREAYHERIQAVEAEWRDKLGANAIQTLRQTLANAVRIEE